MEARFAFTAQYWDEGAVVCRAIEDRPGPIVEQQFGMFPTWTEALGCANKLNEGLDLDALEVRRIVTSSLLATACVLRGSLNCLRQWKTVERAAHAARLRFVMAEVTMALTFCHSASLLSDIPARRAFFKAQNAFQRASLFLATYNRVDPDLEQIASLTKALQTSLQSLAPSFQPSFPAFFPLISDL